MGGGGWGGGTEFVAVTAIHIKKRRSFFSGGSSHSVHRGKFASTAKHAPVIITLFGTVRREHL